jgi:hypothetical protein
MVIVKMLKVGFEDLLIDLSATVKLATRVLQAHGTKGSTPRHHSPRR